MYNELIIKSEKQANGIWGMPLQCIYLDKCIFLDFETELIRSAIVLGLAQFYTNETFEINFSSKEGFLVSFTNKKIRSIYIEYKKYRVEKNRLIWNDVYN